ncbi:hypothetical protein C5B42_03110 [Candidatus Cerribacteria bacterium 'Amazon FNV 2010 28 9']|uniref:Uncharacterized protein n=1 Tax=Candidatus Cerribacteria bacterium 'Amazon FNV 2010 28 9' TaxID=2081795 RepID=A0A317JPT4_9BACT|nr:MAG: hypothetical protein C5B42_03110 [Candidatus Cerribacteria bacterium 'Amazon FNV 2010 28 9']
MRKSILIFVLVILAILTGAYAFWSKNAGLHTQLAQGLSVTPSPTPTRTNTFVDYVGENFLFFTNGQLYEFTLPTLSVHQVLSTDKHASSKLPTVRPTWSNDGKTLALMTDPNTISILDYDSGNNIAVLHPNAAFDTSKMITMTFSPDGNDIAVVTTLDDHADVRLFSIADKKEVYEHADCGSIGFWLKGPNEFVTTCSLNGKVTIIGILPGSSAQVKPIRADQFQLLSAYDDNSIVVKQGTTLGKVTLSGIFSPIPASQLSAFSSIDAIAHPEMALAAKLQNALHTDPIDDLVVASDGQSVLFHTQKGIWVEDIRMREQPYFLIQGSLPSIRP